MMKSKGRRLISVMLIALMVCTASPAFAWTGDSAKAGQDQEPVAYAQAASGEKIADAVDKFAEAMSKFAQDTSEMSKLSSFLTRFGGLTSAASGVVGILQMSGIIQDPNLAKLSEILDRVKDIQTQLKEMDAKLDDIRQELVNIEVSIDEKDRNNNAKAMLKNWSDFNTYYCEPLDDLMKIYEGKINGGIKAWWEKGPKDGVRVVYALVKDEKGQTVQELTYTSESSAKVPAAADNGEAIAAELSFGVPVSLLPNTRSIAFSVDRFRTDYTERMKTAFVNAANGKKLDAQEAFYTAWDKLTAEQKDQAAAGYAEDILNTQIYHISRDVMSANDEWVIEVLNAYRNYCNHVLEQNSGVNAMLNAMYLTHAFEGEIKEDISKFCDAMVVKTGVYGQFALSCAGQDAMQSRANREQVQSQFVDTVIHVSETKGNAILGYDNFCYITGTRVEYAWLDAKSTMRVKIEGVGSGYAFREFSSTNWSLTVPNILDNVKSQVLYHQYQSLNQGKTSFSSYLKAYGAFPWDDWDGDIMTTYHGGKDFAFAEGIPMKAGGYFAGENYFTSGQYYKIDVGTGSNVEQQYYHVHDKLMLDTMSMETGKLKVNRMAGARAFYGESHGRWVDDEAWRFYTDGIDFGTHTTKQGKATTYDETARIHIVALKLRPVLDLNGGAAAANDPFFAFDGPTITAGISDTVGPIVEDRTTPLTSITLKKAKTLLKGDRFIYTGKAIRPKVTVKAKGKTVPAEGYEVSYMDNEELGYAAVIVEGRGDYSGKVIKRFRIIPKGTSIKKIKKKGRSVTLKWKKQTAKMSGARIDGYQIRYSTSPSMKKAVSVNVKGYKKTSGKIKGLKKNRKYYFEIRTYMSEQGRKLYSDWSKTKVSSR